MLIPVGEDVSVPVTLVVLGAIPEFREGRLTRLDPEQLRIELEGPALLVGARVIVNPAGRTKLSGRVLALEGDVTLVSRDKATATDDRAAPRVASNVSLRWRVHPPPMDGASEPWLAGAADPGPFVTFRGNGDLSLSGFRARSSAPMPSLGEHLLVELFLGGEGQRARGFVRRVDPGEEFAVEFAELPEATFDALSEFTIRNL